MQTMFKWLILLLAIVRIEGLGEFWKFRSSSANERTMKSILQTCYKDEISAGPIVVIGDYNIFDDKSSIIRLNHCFEVEEHEDSFKYLKASKIIIIGKTREELVGSLERLSMTQWWKSTAMIFMIDENKECKYMDEIIFASEKMELLNLIYICSDSNGLSALATVNWIANYAPHPWKRLEDNEKNIFTQIFDPNVSCKDLHFDKTKILNGHEIRLIGLPSFTNPDSYSTDQFDTASKSSDMSVHFKLVQTAVIKLNGTGTLKYLKEQSQAIWIFNQKMADLLINPVSMGIGPVQNFLFPHSQFELVAIVRLKPEVSTLEKIHHMWSSPVLCFAAIALLIFFLVLTIMKKDISSAALNLTRLLIYSSILRISGRTPFRIYFTTMLILMVISNGVFQSQIAAFLTKTERLKTIETIDELVELDYKMYTHFGMAHTLERSCDECRFREVSFDECIQYVIDYPRHLCAAEKSSYEQYFILNDLDLVKEKFVSATSDCFAHRENWPLIDTFNGIITRLIETGIIQFWEKTAVEVQRQKRAAMDAERLSAQYRPIKLYKLDFAFHLLALGLGISIIVFLLELLREKERVWRQRFWEVLQRVLYEFS